MAGPSQLVTEPAPPDQETKSLYAQIQHMSVGERIKLALKGNRDTRVLLLRDPNRTVQRFVLQNPRLTEDEVLAACKNRNTDPEILRLVAKKREWRRNYAVRLALVRNPKTPLVVSLQVVSTLADRDVRFLAKSKNVPGAVAGRARRIIIERSSGR